ncbi:MAG TPA: hypothetical protein VHZ95_06835 [Polyangiales bacterium]|jgi:hypothetical protein|nr:hypothetical protein [Polyangiales bacterium]
MQATQFESSDLTRFESIDLTSLEQVAGGGKIGRKIKNALKKIFSNAEIDVEGDADFEY